MQVSEGSHKTEIHTHRKNSMEVIDSEYQWYLKWTSEVSWTRLQWRGIGEKKVKFLQVLRERQNMWVGILVVLAWGCLWQEQGKS